MSLDWPNLLANAGVIAVITLVVKQAGERGFAFIANKLNPKPPEPVQIDGKFVATRFAPGECAWVNETERYDYEEKGYTYYPHPRSNARCFRITSDGREFLLVQPGAKEVSST